MITTRKNYKDEFIKSLQCEDPKTLLETWHNRSNDDFYSTLEELKCLTDKQFPSETNPILFVMMAYCFDGNRYKSVDKVRSILSSFISEDNKDNSYDDILSKFIDLETTSDYDESKTLFDINSKLNVSDYYDLIVSGFDKDYGIKGRNLRVIPKENSLLYYFDAFGDEEDLQWLKDNLFIKLPGEENFMKRVITFSLRDNNTKEFFDLLYLSECYPISYEDNIDRNRTITLEFESFEQFFSAECDRPFVENVKKDIQNKLNSMDEEDIDVNDKGDIDYGDYPPLSEKSTTLDMANMDSLIFRLSGYDKDECIHFENLKLSYNSNSDFTFEIGNIDLSTNTISGSLVGHLDAFDEARGMVSKSDIVKDMRIDLYDSEEQKLYGIAELKNAYVIEYVFNNDNHQCSMKIVCETFFIDDPDDDQVANYLRTQLSNVMTDLYRDMTFKTSRAWNEYA